MYTDRLYIKQKKIGKIGGNGVEETDEQNY